MSKKYMKAGIPVSDLYDTINELSGYTGDGVPGQSIIGESNGSVQVGRDDCPVTFVNVTSASGPFVNTSCVQTWTDKYINGVHNFTCPSVAPWIVSEIGRVLIATGSGAEIYDKSKGINVNGINVKEVYTGAEYAEELFPGQQMMFIVTYSAGRATKINFVGSAGGMSKLMTKAAGAENAFTGTVYFGASGSGATINPQGRADFRDMHTNTATFTGAVSAQDISCRNLAASGTANITGKLTATGGVAVHGNLTGNNDGAITGFTKVYNAIWNDYAELFPRGEETEPGDIIALDLNSDNEQYVKASLKNPDFVGVQSNEFAHLIGGERVPDGEDFYEYNIKKYIPVALAGRVHVKVRGPVRRGELIGYSEEPGIGKECYSRDYAVGFALEDKFDDDVGLVKIKVL